MTKSLSAAGLSKERLELVIDVVDTCKECRKWQKPGKEVVATLSVSTKFNEHVEMDLMFYRKYVICHFIDRASRWHAAQMVPGKSDTELLEALLTCWIQIHGPMKELIVDGERGVVASKAFNDELKARGITLKPPCTSATCEVH